MSRLRSRLDEPAPAPNPSGETRQQRHIRMLTDVRDRLRAVMTARGLLRTAPGDPVLCRLHGQPWTTCPLCSKNQVR